MRSFYIRTNLDKEVRQALRDIDKYGENTQKRLKKAVKRGTKSTAEKARNKAPRRSGHLAGSIRMEYDEGKNTGRVRATAPHAHLVESGAGVSFVVPKRKKILKANGFFFKSAVIPARKAQPFMSTAFEEEKPRIMQDIKEALEP